MLSFIKKHLTEISEDSAIDDVNNIDQAVEYIEECLTPAQINVLQQDLANHLHSNDEIHNEENEIVDSDLELPVFNSLKDPESQSFDYSMISETSPLKGLMVALARLESCINSSLNAVKSEEFFLAETPESSPTYSSRRIKAVYEQNLSCSTEFDDLKRAYLDSVIKSVEKPDELDIPLMELNKVLTRSKKAIDCVNFLSHQDIRITDSR